MVKLKEKELEGEPDPREPVVQKHGVLRGGDFHP